MRFGQAEIAVIARAILERHRLELLPGYELSIRHAPTISPRAGCRCGCAPPRRRPCWDEPSRPSPPGSWTRSCRRRGGSRLAAPCDDWPLVLTAGRVLLIFALAIALYGVARVALRCAHPQHALALGGRSGRAWIASGRRSVYALFGMLAVCFVILEAAFLRSDFSFELVASHSSTTTPTFYQATAIWSSQEGSLLFWVLLLSAWSSAILFLVAPPRARDRALRDGRAARDRGVLLRPARVPRDAVRRS